MAEVPRREGKRKLEEESVESRFSMLLKLSLVKMEKNTTILTMMRLGMQTAAG
ncbi:hypothetical protein MTR67_008506 [Solanum verrucosum]|uniref:Uncharacterized protein n=1 Tax=Solanum verrucosum TaxID=315347 RepID=A0AAF0Q1R3_SOLVR|nr:hypothetical protein MTR67_008506 [Solanum verrucosum]